MRHIGGSLGPSHTPPVRKIVGCPGLISAIPRAPVSVLGTQRPALGIAGSALEPSSFAISLSRLRHAALWQRVGFMARLVVEKGDKEA